MDGESDEKVSRSNSTMELRGAWSTSPFDKFRVTELIQSAIRPHRVVYQDTSV